MLRLRRVESVFVKTDVCGSSTWFEFDTRITNNTIVVTRTMARSKHDIWKRFGDPYQPVVGLPDGEGRAQKTFFINSKSMEYLLTV